MKKIFVAKKIITMDASHPFATHVAVENGKIVGIGDSEMKELFSDAILDETFKDQVILPGFVEGHAHMVAGQDGLAAYVGYFDRPSPEGTILKGLKSMDEIITYLKTCDAKLSPDEPLIATGFDPIYFEGKRVERYDLDKITTERMIFLMHASGHLITTNSKAIEAIPADKLASTQGVAKDDQGKPTGELQEIQAMSLAFALLGASFLKFTDPKVLFPRFVALAQRAGVTTITEMGVDINLDDPRSIEELSSLTEHVSLRVVPMYFVPTSTKKIEDMPAYVQSLVAKNTDRLRFGLVKFMADGSIQGYTARLKAPYITGVENGIWNMDPEKIQLCTKAFHDAGLSIHCHCNGDEASEVFIAAVKDAIAQKPWPDNRHIIQHGQMIDEAQFQDMKKLGMGANLFTNHIYFWGDQHVAKTIGLARAEKMDAANTALSLGVPFSLHCDASVTPIAPLFNAWTAVNRVTASGKVLGEAEKISVADALYAMTMGSAYLLRMENEIGSIMVGKKADFVVLGEDPYEIDPMKLKDIPVITTIFTGENTKH
ncbi:MAG: amidohydrolase [Candidatus Levybacteria bacterium]|nr:amidohydrolase [Candidatus Levybacteria bacterium]